jgi:ATP-dependent Clp protease ATP-binding subunit ClpC
MHQRLSQRAEKIVKLASEIAREYEQDYVGTEHVLLAVEREGTGVGAQILRGHGLNGTRIKDEVDKLVKKSMEDTWVFGRLPGTPHFRNVVATAIEQAQQLESKEVCSEHLLLALLREKGSVACTALKNLQLNYADVREDVLRMASSSA